VCVLGGAAYRAGGGAREKPLPQREDKGVWPTARLAIRRRPLLVFAGGRFVGCC